MVDYDLLSQSYHMKQKLLKVSEISIHRHMIKYLEIANVNLFFLPIDKFKCTSSDRQMCTVCTFTPGWEPLE